MLKAIKSLFSKGKDIQFVWVKIEDNPHAGVASISGSKNSPFESSFKIEGVGPEWAWPNVMGKVLNRSKLPKNGGSISVDSFFNLLR